MFKCGICLKPSKPKEKAHRVVVETRHVNYPFIAKAHKYIDFETGTEKIKDDPGGEGEQIVREVLAHAGCVNAS